MEIQAAFPIGFDFTNVYLNSIGATLRRNDIDGAQPGNSVDGLQVPSKDGEDLHQVTATSVIMKHECSNSPGIDSFDMEPST